MKNEKSRVRGRPGNRLQRWLTSGLLLTAVATCPAAAEKTDRILVANGNEIIGEIQELKRGRLKVSTGYMGTVQMDASQVRRVESRLDFEVETRDGEIYFGSLAPRDEDYVLVAQTEDELVRIPFDELLRLEQTKLSFWGDIDASIAFGFSFTQSTDVTQVSFDGSFSRRTKGLASRLQLLWISSDTADESSSRQDIDFTIRRHLRRRPGTTTAPSWRRPTRSSGSTVVHWCALVLCTARCGPRSGSCS
jgi:hypothetical protein